jgi:SAM-dependent methyltransferase
MASMARKLGGYALRAARRPYQRVRDWAYGHPQLYEALQRVRRLFAFVYPESALAHRYLDGLKGLEIGAGAANPFGLDTLSVDFVPHYLEPSGPTHGVRPGVKLDAIACGDILPFKDACFDFVVTSHVIEHFFDPIRALKEWRRVVRPGGYLFVIVPHKERTFDKARPRTPLAELIERHAAGTRVGGTEAHHSVWITEDFLELCRYLELNVVEHHDVDDKAGNGFTVVIRKPV